MLSLAFGTNPLRAEDSPATDSASRVQSSVIAELDIDGKDIFEALDVIVAKSGLNIEADSNISGQVTVHLKDIDAKDALRVMLDSNGLAFAEEEGVIRVMSAQNFQQKYSRSFNEEIQTRIVPLSFADPADARASLGEIKSSDGKIFSMEKPKALVLIDQPSKIDEMSALIKEMDVQRFTMVFELGFAKAADLSQKVEGVLTKNTGRVKFDEQSNKLIVTDTSAKIEEIRKIVNAIDRRDRQVSIETKIVQVALNDEHLTGVDWEAIVSDYKSLNMTEVVSRTSDKNKNERLSIGTIAEEDCSILMEALETVGQVDVLSSPSVVTNNNKEARILVGGNQPYASGSNPSDSATEGQTRVTEFVDMGVKLFVTPAVHADGSMAITIRPQVSSVSASLPGTGSVTPPVVETTQAQTVLELKKGLAIVIGGLIREEKSKVTKKIPFLGDVPFLGMAFRTYTHHVQKTEVIIFMTPRVLETAAPEESKK